MTAAPKEVHLVVLQELDDSSEVILNGVVVPPVPSWYIIFGDVDLRIEGM